MTTTRRRRAARSRNGRLIRWTPAEEQVLIDAIGQNPTCLKAAFLAASMNLTRTPSACSYHWYKHMANRDDVIAKLTIGNGVVIKNKTVKVAENSDLRKSIVRGIWERICNLLYR